MRHKKSQMEMFGLAMIVILIIVGFFIFVSFRSKTPVQNYRNEYIADQTATNFVNSIVNVNIKECDSNTLKNILISCAKKDNTQCNGKDACIVANETLLLIANRSLMRQYFSFNLYTQGLDNEIRIENLDCKDKERGQRGYVALTLYPIPKDIYLNLDICK